MSQSFARRALTPRKGYEFWRADFWFGQVDSRPLSVFRIVLALLLIKDAIYDLSLARDFFSDDGLTPRSALIDGLARGPRFSLMDAMPTTWMASVFFLLWIAVLIMLLVGYRTRLMSILNLLIIVSIHERNVYILNGADTVFRVLSVWSVFLPLGHYYSVDALRARLARYRLSRAPSDLRVTDEPRTTWAFPLRLIQLQVIIIYAFTGVLKIIEPSVWRTGGALYYALQLKSLTLPTGDWMVAYAPLWLMVVLNYQTLITEIGFPIFVMLPFFQPYLRMGGLGLGVLLHVGIAVTMAISNFSMVMVATYLLFFEPGWIKWLDARLRRLRPGELPSRVGIPPRASPLWLLIGATREEELMMAWDETSSPEFDSWTIRDEKGRSLSGLAAWQRAAGHLPLSRGWAWALRPAPVRRAIWAGLRLAAARAMIPMPDAEAEAFPPQAAPPKALRVARTTAKGVLAAALGSLMGLVIWWNLSGVQIGEEYIYPPVPRPAVAFIDYPGLWQDWGMFAPYPQTFDGWIVIPGKFEDGKTFDLRTGLPVSSVQPRTYIGNVDRWKKYEDNLERDRYPELLYSWAAMYCQKYNDEQRLPWGQRLATLEIIYKLTRSHAPGQPPNPTKDILLWKHWCYARYEY